MFCQFMNIETMMKSRFDSCRKVVENLLVRASKRLPAEHAFTVCDLTSKFSKQSAALKLITDDLVMDVLSTLT